MNNELYIGRRVWGRTTYVKDPTTGKRQCRPRRDDACYVEDDVPELRIVDDGLWQQVKARQDEMRIAMAQDENGNPLNRARRAQKLLSGLLVCGVCGSPYVMVDNRRYGCNKHRSKATCANHHKVSRADIEARVGEVLRRRLMAPRVVEDLLRRMTNAQQENAGRVDTERAAMTATRYHLESKIEKLVSAITDAGHSPALLAKLASLEGDKAKLEIEITALDDAATPLPPMSADEIVEVYNILINDHVLKLFDRDAVSDQNAEGAGHMRNVLRSMIERITLTPLADDSGLEATLQGDFCNILASVGMGQAIESKDPSAGTEGSSSSVVAGARIGRDRHSLMVVI